MGQLQGHPRLVQVDNYGLKAPVANPDGSSADELTAIKTLRGQPDMPEVVDVGPSFTSQMVTDGYAETYKPTVWDQIPDNLKDPNGKWVAAYYGVMSIASNTTLVKNPPLTWADLKKPEYKGQVDDQRRSARGRRGVRGRDGGVARQRRLASTTSCRASSSSPT